MGHNKKVVQVGVFYFHSSASVWSDMTHYSSLNYTAENDTVSLQVKIC